MDEWMRWQPSPRRGPFASLETSPPRVVVGVGAAIAVIAGLMPWATGRAPGLGGFDDVFFGGLGGAGDGIVLLLLSAGAGFLTLHHTPATSRVRTIRLAPAILVALAAVTWIGARRAALDAIAAWERRGGSGNLAPGLWLAAFGIVLMAVGSAWLLPSVLRWRTVPGDPTDVVAVRPRDVAVALGGLGGTVVGAAIGISLGLGMTGSQLLGVLAFGAVFGGLFGAYGGAWLVRQAIGAVARTGGGRAAPADRPSGTGRGTGTDPAALAGDRPAVPGQRLERVRPSRRDGPTG